MGPIHKKVGPWTVQSTARVYENPWIALDHHDVTHPDGSPGIYGVTRFRNRAIGILAVDQNGRVPLVGQHRFPLDRYSWEVPEGGGPLTEDPLTAAKRELQEETGFVATHWLKIVEMDLSNSVTDEIAVGYIAWGLTAGQASPEPSEELQLDFVSFSSLLNRCLSGEIRDSLTFALTLATEIRARQGDLPSDFIALLN